LKVKKITIGTAKKLVDGTLPDIDSDFSGKDRASIKKYMEQRFGETQVCSVGTYSTMKPKGLIKDLARVNGVDFSEANLITSMIDKDAVTMFDLFKCAQSEPKLKYFIKKNSDIFHMLPTLLGQNKAKSIHACAMIVFPEVMGANEFAPMRTQDGMLVSEWGGGEMDDAGFLKDDILAIKQLEKFTEILKLIKKNGKDVPDIYNLPYDSEVYRYFSNGWNGDVFQMGSEGLTGYTKQLQPQNIGDLVAAVALYRPAAMENHYHEIYVKCKNEGRQPEYLWGTEEIAKDTFGLLIYQEQVMQVFQQLGGLSMKEADDVRRAMGKKKLSVLLPWRDRVESGYLERGATKQQFQESWDAMMEFAKYGFNLSHSACYALTGYICQYLKVNYPIEYWTVALSKGSEEDVLRYLSEILQAKQITISPPDINSSGILMTENQDRKTIYWGIGSIKGIGEETAEQIVQERRKNGEYKSFADFFFRTVYKGSKVKKTTIEALIASGAFDELYDLEGREKRRMLLIKRYRKLKKVKVANPQRDAYTIGSVNENWWWKKQQKTLSGLAFIDYKKIAEDEGFETPFCTVDEINRPQNKEIFRTFGGHVLEVKVGKTKRGKWARITIDNNYKIYSLMCWSDEFAEFGERLEMAEKSLIIFTASIKYEAKWGSPNQLTLLEDSEIKIL